MVKSQTLITVLIAAVGGQGGQLFAQWLFDAAREAGFAPVGVGLPGLSQREGATIYYLEFFARPEETSLFSPFPEKGKVDVLVGLELLELLRAVRDGYLSDNGTVIGSTHRVLTSEEKLSLKGDFLTAEQTLHLLQQQAKRCVVFDAVKAAALAGLSERAANAILFGALAASGFLPFPQEAFRRAIEHYGVAVDFNLKAFEFGLRYSEWLDKLRTVDNTLTSEWDSLPEPKLPEGLQKRIDKLSVDDNLSTTLQNAAKWLCHYQDAKYFALYLDNVERIYERDRKQGDSLSVTKEVARILASRMAYEDAIRVAQLKTERSRFERLREEHQLKGDTFYRVVDFFGPDWDELVGLIPIRWLKSQSGETEVKSDESELPKLPSQSEELRRSALQLRLEATSLTGFLLLKALIMLKPLRPHSQRFKREWAAISEWLAEVGKALGENYELALLIARSGEVVRGYGRTRRRTLAAWKVFVSFLNALKKRKVPFDKIVSEGEKFLSLVTSGPQGPEKAWQFAKERLDELQG